MNRISLFKNRNYLPHQIWFPTFLIIFTKRVKYLMQTCEFTHLNLQEMCTLKYNLIILNYFFLYLYIFPKGINYLESIIIPVSSCNSFIATPNKFPSLSYIPATASNKNWPAGTLNYLTNNILLSFAITNTATFNLNLFLYNN